MTGVNDNRRQSDREKRLAEALRENLSRRKAQARNRREPPAQGVAQTGVDAGDDAGGGADGPEGGAGGLASTPQGG